MSFNLGSLTAGRPFWPARSSLDEVPQFPTLDHDTDCEIAIIGGGITGAFVAYKLSRAGLKTVLLESRQVGSASTSASTSLLLYELDVPLIELAEMIGFEKAARVYRLGIDAIRMIAEIASEIGEAGCAFEKRRSLQVAVSKKDAVALQREFEIRQSCGISVEYLDAAHLAARYPFARPGAILSQDAAQSDPLRLTRQMLRKSVERGLKIYENSPVISIDNGSTRGRLRLAGGQTVTADHVVIATGYAPIPQLTQQIPWQIQSTYAIVTEPLPDTIDPFWPERCLIWETGNPYAYLRMTDDHRALIGGEDDDRLGPAAFAQLPQKQKSLEAKFASFFPEVKFKTDSTWSGTFITTPDGMPYIAEIPGMPNVHAALCYGGNGMTFGAIAARIITDQILGRLNEDSELFRFDRTRKI